MVYFFMNLYVYQLVVVNGEGGVEAGGLRPKNPPYRLDKVGFLIPKEVNDMFNKSV